MDAIYVIVAVPEVSWHGLPVRYKVLLILDCSARIYLGNVSILIW